MWGIEQQNGRSEILRYASRSAFEEGDCGEIRRAHLVLRFCVRPSVKECADAACVSVDRGTMQRSPTVLSGDTEQDSSVRRRSCPQARQRSQKSSAHVVGRVSVSAGPEQRANAVRPPVERSLEECAAPMGVEGVAVSPCFKQRLHRLQVAPLSCCIQRRLLRLRSADGC